MLRFQAEDSARPEFHSFPRTTREFGGFVYLRTFAARRKSFGMQVTEIPSCLLESILSIEQI